MTDPKRPDPSAYPNPTDKTTPDPGSMQTPDPERHAGEREEHPPLRRDPRPKQSLKRLLLVIVVVVIVLILVAIAVMLLSDPQPQEENPEITSSRLIEGAR